MRTFASCLSVALKGICMGAADVIPGVSGGTIAFMAGIYEELVNSIKSINTNSLKLLIRGRFREFWYTINGGFLLSLATGILISVFSLAKLMQYLLANHPVPIWSFFFGLILVSAYYILTGIKGFRWHHILAAVAGIFLGAAVCLAAPAETTDALWFVFLCGMIAICAMILPGISGSFILLLLGKYAYIMTAVSELNIPVLIIFSIGAIIGILSFSRLLSWMLKNFYNGTLCFLSGLMLGSLIKVWPWKNVTAGGISHPVLPNNYIDNPLIWQAVVSMLAGILLVVIVNSIAARKSHTEGA